METEKQFCLKWNNHRATLFSVFDTLLEEESLVDVTLSAEGQFLRAHRVILSACSPYFRVSYPNSFTDFMLKSKDFDVCLDPIRLAVCLYFTMCFKLFYRICSNHNI